MREKYVVVTGDITGFTAITANKRAKLITSTDKLISSWVEQAGRAKIFRGDSFQMLFQDITEACLRCIQLRCWLKQYPNSKKGLDARMAVGFGEISYKGKSVLVSDGEAFHLSGRAFDDMQDDEFLRMVTPDGKKNEQLKIILRLMDILISGWTPGQAEVIYLLIENKTQQQIAGELNVTQSAVNNRIKLTKWKDIEKTIHYIASVIEQP
ncbi:MAG TPA: hypothetical protein VEV16_04345 [Daejeonella sp.]|nr:hypothetical protein [Daejeonella sp.]